MQSILEQTVKTLHEANEHPATADDEQLTILDALTLLADDDFKAEVLAKVNDPYPLQWWARWWARREGTWPPWWARPSSTSLTP